MYISFKAIFLIGRSFCGPRGAASAFIYSIARGLLAPGPLGYFCHAAKVPKNALRKLRFLRTFLDYGGYYIRYDLQISGLSPVLWANATPCFCTQFYRWYWLPRGTRHEGLVMVQTCKLVPLEHVPLAGSTPLKGRQPDPYKYQSGRRRT